jgi:uncharacterized protein (DUF58 family)
MRWLVAAILVLLLALLFNFGILAYAIYVLLALALLTRFLVGQWSENLTADRQCNRLTAFIGDRVAVLVRIENASRVPVPWVLLEDLLPRRALVFQPPHLAVSGQRLQLAMFKPRSSRSLLYQLTCNRRGYYQLGPLVLETGDLFGLFRRYRLLTEPHFLLVYPRVIPLEGFELASKRPIGEVRMSYRLFEDPTRIAGVRAYERGDSLNRVHWKATARTGVLHSKVYEPSTVAGVTLLLDFHQAAHDPRHEPVRSELAVTAAASIANAMYELGQQVGLVTNGRDAADRIRIEGWQVSLRTRDAARRVASMRESSDRLQPLIVPTRRGPEQVMRIYETLARVELTDGLELPSLIEETAARMPRDATVVAILPRVRDVDAIALANLQQRGYAVTAILNLYDEFDFAQAAGPLLSAGITVQHLPSEAAVATICRKLVLR